VVVGELERTGAELTSRFVDSSDGCGVVVVTASSSCPTIGPLVVSADVDVDVVVGL